MSFVSALSIIYHVISLSLLQFLICSHVLFLNFGFLFEHFIGHLSVNPVYMNLNLMNFSRLAEDLEPYYTAQQQQTGLLHKYTAL